MKLFHSSTSPFVRKVLVAAEERGLRGRIEIVPAVLSPTSPDANLSAVNPLGKIPALIMDEGDALFDSHVIVDYLDSLGAAPKLIPANGRARYETLRREALADGVTEAGILVRYEHVLRPESQRSQEWIDAQMRKVRGGLAMLEAEVEAWPHEMELGQIAVGCALGWLSFRAIVQGLRETFPKLHRAFDRLSERPSFARTIPG